MLVVHLDALFVVQFYCGAVELQVADVGEAAQGDNDNVGTTNYFTTFGCHCFRVCHSLAIAIAVTIHLSFKLYLLHSTRIPMNMYPRLDHLLVQSLSHQFIKTCLCRPIAQNKVYLTTSTVQHVCKSHGNKPPADDNCAAWEGFEAKASIQCDAVSPDSISIG